MFNGVSVAIKCPPVSKGGKPQNKAVIINSNKNRIILPLPVLKPDLSVFYVSLMVVPDGCCVLNRKIINLCYLLKV